MHAQIVLLLLLLCAAGGSLQHERPSAAAGDYEHGLTAWLDSVGAGSCAPVRRMHREPVSLLGGLTAMCLSRFVPLASWLLGAEFCRTRICQFG